MRPPFSLVLPKKTGRARSKRKTLFSLRKRLPAKNSSRSVGRGRRSLKLADACHANWNYASCSACRFDLHSFPLSLLWCLRRSSAKRLHSCWRLCRLTDMAYPLRVSGKRGDRSTGKFVYHHGFTNKLTTCGGMVIRIPMSGAASRRPVVLSAPIRDTPVLSKTRCVLCQHLFF